MTVVVARLGLALIKTRNAKATAALPRAETRKLSPQKVIVELVKE